MYVVFGKKTSAPIGLKRLGDQGSRIYGAKPNALFTFARFRRAGIHDVLLRVARADRRVLAARRRVRLRVDVDSLEGFDLKASTRVVLRR